MATEAAQPLFYNRIVPLSKEAHGDLHLEPRQDYSFAAETNSVYIAAVEFIRAAKEYPIVFAGQGDNLFPLALLGVRERQNLYLEDGMWKARYIPAYVRRYPFVLATPDQQNYTVCIDESYDGFNNEKGERLFAEDGSNGPLLEQSVTFLKDYQAHIVRTTEFCQHLQKLELLEPMQANIEKDGEKIAVGGFMVVNRERLKQLKQGQVLALFKKDELELIYAHLASMENMAVLLERMG